jgi:hypothetical protein
MKLNSFRPILEPDSAPLFGGLPHSHPTVLPLANQTRRPKLIAPENGFLRMGVTLLSGVRITQVVSPFPLHRSSIPISGSP